MNIFRGTKIKFFKKDGTEIGTVEATVQDGKIFTNQKILVKINDYFIYQNPLGAEERLVVDQVSMPTRPGGNFHHLEITCHKDIK